jgi:uncharacterized membrane protein YhfC
MDLLTITHFLNWLLMIALPILLGIYLTEKFHMGWKLWLIGAATFVISQVFHIPFNIYILNPAIEGLQSALQGISPQLIAAILLGLSAGVFEECSRYGMFRWWIKDNRTWRGAVLTGAGHGGIEAIILGILVILQFINLLVYRNSDLSNLNLTPLGLLVNHQTIQAYWNLPWYATLLGAVERAFTIPFHIAASVIVLQVFTRRLGRHQLRWLGLAIFYHALMDASVVFIASKWGGYAAEAFMGGFAILDVIIIFALRRPEPEATEPPSTSPPGKTPTFTPLPVEETTENLENSRYQ